MSNDEAVRTSRLWHGRLSLVILVLVALGLPIAYPELGVLGSFAIAIAVVLIARKHGSFADLGLRRPESWPKLLATTLIYGFAIQMIFTIAIEPGLSRLTGDPVDISIFDGVRGNFVNFLLMMALGWVVGGFLEEFTFRGFIVGRVRWLLGSGTTATWAAVLAAAVPFGVAHYYQGTTGMIATGMIGFVLGTVYVYHGFNLWYAMFTHGFVNTVGIVALYLNIDQDMSRWLF